MDEGLPPLGQYSGNSSFQSRPSYGLHTPSGKSIVSIQRSFGILDDCKKTRLKRVRSALWMKVHDGGSKTWENESSIQQLVTDVLQEVINCCDLTKYLDLVQEKTFSVNQSLKTLRPDIALIRNQYGSIVGVCEVKKPTTGSVHRDAQNDLYDDYLMVQISNYMLELRYTYGLQFVFGIVSTYNHWRVVWLKDSDEVAQVENQTDMSSARLIDDTADANQVIYASDVIPFNDKKIVEFLASVIKKMHQSPIVPPTGLQLDLRKFPCLSTMHGNGIAWHRFGKNIKFSYVMPGARNEQFILIRSYQHGRDGHVYLASSKKGGLAVLKFLHDGNKRTGQSELYIWKEIWGAKHAATIDIYGSTVVKMPFVFHYRLDNTGKHLGFMPVHQWTSPDRIISADVLLGNEQILENRQFDRNSINQFIGNPLAALEQALKNLAQFKIVHSDIEWRHLALMPYQETGSEWNVRPIMIDLSDTKKVGAEDEAWDAMKVRFEELKTEFNSKLVAEQDAESVV